MEQKGIITRLQQPWGNKKVIIIIKYKGRKILEQYEQIFPMKDSSSCFQLSYLRLHYDDENMIILFLYLKGNSLQSVFV